MDRIQITEPGAYDVPEDVYHADEFLPMPSLSSSGARKLLPPSCPALFDHERRHRRETSALRFGKAAHLWLLERKEWDSRFVVLPHDHSNRTNDGKKLVADIQRQGKTPLSFAEFEKVKAMAEAIKAHEFAYGAFERGLSEKTLVHFDEEFGIWTRCRPDFFPRGHAIVPDYKTTVSADPEDIRKSMWTYNYHAQAAWYLDIVMALGLIEAPRFLFIFQEKEPPYLVTCVTPSDTALEWGRIQNRKAKEIFATCLHTGKWPGYADNILTVDLPGWAENTLQRKHGEGDFEVVQRAYAPHAAAE